MAGLGRGGFVSPATLGLLEPVFAIKAKASGGRTQCKQRDLASCDGEERKGLEFSK